MPWLSGLLLILGAKGINATEWVAILFFSLLLLAWILYRISRNANLDKGDPPRAVMLWIAVPEFLTCALLAICTWYYVSPESSFMKGAPGWKAQTVLFSAKFPCLHHAFTGLCHALPIVLGTAVMYTILWLFGTCMSPASHPLDKAEPLSRSPRWAPVRWAFLAGIFAGVFLLLGARVLGGLNAWSLLTFGVPMAVVLVLGVGCIHLGLIGRAWYDDLREWWARLGGAIMGIVICWLVIFLMALYVPLGLKLLWRLLAVPAPHWAQKLWKTLGALGVTGAAGAWVTTTIRGILAAKGPDSGAPANSAAAAAHPREELLARLAPPVFLLGVLILISYLVYLITHITQNSPAASPGDVAGCCRMYWNLLPASGWWKILLFALIMLLVSLLFGWRVDANEFSMQNAYRNRLVRCYLGAVHPGRKGQAFTGFDDNDDFALHNLQGLAAPFPILNTTLNATKSNDLALQARKAYSFALTPLYSGFGVRKERPGRDAPGQKRVLQPHGKLRRKGAPISLPWAGHGHGDFRSCCQSQHGLSYQSLCFVSSYRLRHSAGMVASKSHAARLVEERILETSLAGAVA